MTFKKTRMLKFNVLKRLLYRLHHRAVSLELSSGLGTGCVAIICEIQDLCAYCRYPPGRQPG